MTQDSQTPVNKSTESLSLPKNKFNRLSVLSQQGVLVPSFSFFTLNDISEDALQKFLAEFTGADENIFLAVRPVEKPDTPLVRTILNIGFSDASVKAFAESSKDERLAFDCYRRFIEAYADLVDDVPDYLFEEISDEYGDTPFSVEQLKLLCDRYKELYTEETGKVFPQTLEEQLLNVLNSLKQNAADLEVADLSFIIQKMVFGNASEDSCSGVISSRYSQTGKKNPSVKYQFKAQYEDLILYPESNVKSVLSNDKFLSQFQEDISQIIQVAESAFKTAVDISFVIESGKLYLLNCHELECSPKAKMLIAHDFVEEENMSEEEGLCQLDEKAIEDVLSPSFDKDSLDESQVNKIASGESIGPGAVSGVVCTSVDSANKCADEGLDYIFVKEDTHPGDFEAMLNSTGILTKSGGKASHAAVVARQYGKVCVGGLDELSCDEESDGFSISDHEVKDGDLISVDGETGNIYKGEIESTTSPIIEALTDNEENEESKAFESVMSWAGEHKELEVLANVDLAEDLSVALALGAQGVGLTRIEHLFNTPERLLEFQKVLLSEDASKSCIKAFLIDDFVASFQLLSSLPYTVRLLDPPIHEFMPKSDSTIRDLAQNLAMAEEVIFQKVADIKEKNPMLGLRGCRLGILNEALTRVQLEALFEAYLKSDGKTKAISLEVMVPFIASVEEFIQQKRLILSVAKSYDLSSDDIKIGAMIELPRAALLAGEIAPEVDFVSFGTNDLTQTVLGVSRDDAASFLPYYTKSNPNCAVPIYEGDPFETLDIKGVGLLIKSAVKQIREANPKVKVGVCGEHGGDPASIAFFHEIGLDYVSCSPYRVPIAKVSAAQSAILEK